jgi:hypothetical protein
MQIEAKKMDKKRKTALASNACRAAQILAFRSGFSG